MGFIEIMKILSFWDWDVSVPLRGMGFICDETVTIISSQVSVPLRGMGFIGKNAYAYFNIKTHC